MNPETPESKFNIEKEYNPEGYLQTLPRLFADQEVRRKIDELQNTPEGEMTDEEFNTQLRELEGQLLNDEEYGRLIDATVSQLQNDVVLLRKDNPNTLDAVLESRKAEVEELIHAWWESGPSIGGIAPPNRTDREALQAREKVAQSVRSFLQEVANRNIWEIGFGEDSPTWRIEQSIYVSDGQRTVAIEPSLLKFEDRSAIGFNEDLVQNLGLSHIRKYADLRSGKHLDRKSYNFSAPQTFSLEDGWPNIERMPTKEEIAFLERVISAYY